LARLPRLTLPGQAHWLIQRGHSARAVFADDEDRQTYLAALREAAGTEEVRIHAYALLDGEVQLLATPLGPTGLSRLMQAVGRHYVSAHHRRHGGSGTLWDGRFRCAVVEPGATLLDVLCLLDSQPGGDPALSVGHRTGGRPVPWLVDPPDYWQLGNTPFERQAAWRRRVAEGIGATRADALRSAALGNWVVGSPRFAAEVGAQTARPAAPRPRGRPRRDATSG